MRPIRLNRRLRRRRGDSGQSLVEFALLLPVLLVIIIAVVDFGLMFYHFQVMTNAAREGARRAVLADATIDDNAVFTAIQTALGPALPSGATVARITEAGGGCGALPTGAPATVEVYACGWSGSPPDVPDARVRIRMPYEAILLGRFLSWTTGQPTFTLSTGFVMRNE